ncbi:MAG: VWA domain-containing protein, partial [Desulfomonile tiedjei]|nr:VWA domain-containing protein [Desulfomonile tiedjei]
MTLRKIWFIRSCLAAMALMFLNFAEGSYNACVTPPMVGIGAKPNVMIVMDHSGSMQFPAYIPGNFVRYYANGSHVADCDSRDGEPALEQYKSYDPIVSFYGYFESDVYYVYNTADLKNPYFETSANPPVSPVKFTASSSKASAGIWFTAAGHNFKTGDVVAFFNLTSHTAMNSKNGRAFRVEEVSGDRFRVNYQWNGVPDQDTGSVIKRVIGEVRTGLSGNILNFVTTSRIDASLKSLIGGKADCTGENCFLRSQGSRRYFRENSNIDAGFYVRPGTIENPENFDTGDYYSKDVFLTIEPVVKGKLDERDPLSTGRTQDGLPERRTEVWYFTLKESRTVTIKVESSAFSPSLYLFQGQRPGAPYISKSANSVVSGKAVMTSLLTPGTYSVEVTSDAGTSSQGAYAVLANVDLQSDAHPSHNASKPKIGAMADARVRLKVPKSARSGIVQDTFDKIRYGFMYYKGEQEKDHGKILVGCENGDLARLVDAIQGMPGATGSYSQAIYPYGATPTGTALSEAYSYFTQTQSPRNPDFVALGTSKDPYYDSAGAVSCRRSYVLLVSDGQWNSGGDPVVDALRLRRESSGSEDLRPDMSGLQYAKTLSFYSFGEEVGRRSM